MPLDRSPQTNTTALCTSTEDCDSTIIPLKNSVVVPGGRYREVYYWDSYWILQGLLHSGVRAPPAVTADLRHR
jgi:neutral trehalase